MTGEPRLAQNSEAGVFTLNPVEWAKLSIKYRVGSVELIRKIVAITRSSNKARFERKVLGISRTARRSWMTRLPEARRAEAQMGRSYPNVVRKGLLLQGTCNVRT